MLLAVALAIAVATLCSGCFTVIDPDPRLSPASSPASYLARIKAASLVQPTSTAAQTSSAGVNAFVVPGRDVACVMTTSRGGHLNTPLEPNDYGNTANQPFPVVPVVSCELAAYPDPQPQDAASDCAKTGIGYRGGAVLLSPEAVVYGSCRAGLNGMEASGDDSSSTKKLIASLPALADGAALEAQGYRCASLDGGVACANLAQGVGFFVNKTSYQLFGPGQRPTGSSTGSSAGSPTPSH